MNGHACSLITLDCSVQNLHQRTSNEDLSRLMYLTQVTCIILSKVEGVHGRMLFISGADIVDGTVSLSSLQMLCN